MVYSGGEPYNFKLLLQNPSAPANEAERPNEPIQVDSSSDDEEPIEQEAGEGDRPVGRAPPASPEPYDR